MLKPISSNRGAASKFKMDYDATNILHVFRDRIHITKNRYGPTGNVELEELIDFSLQIIAEKAFNGTAKVFQEGLIEDMKEGIKQAFEKNSKFLIKEK